MDPQQRLLLETASEALQAASVNNSSSLQAFSNRLGAYMGVASSDYGTLVKEFTQAGAFHATSNAISVAAGRLSYTFGLAGPSVSVDTACSASLVALHLARSDIASNSTSRYKAALVGGVHVQTTATSTHYVWAAGMLSPEGRCKVLDATADGYVRGEACHMLLVTSFVTASAEHSGVSAMILGSAVNQDGRSSSLTAPNGPAQQDVIQAAVAEASVTGAALDMLSLHGTGMAICGRCLCANCLAVHNSDVWGGAVC